MQITSAPLTAASRICPGPPKPMSISPESNAAIVNVPLGMTTYCRSSPCFWKIPCSLATHTAVMLSLVIAPAKLVFTVAVWPMNGVKRIKQAKIKSPLGKFVFKLVLSRD